LFKSRFKWFFKCDNEYLLVILDLYVKLSLNFFFNFSNLMTCSDDTVLLVVQDISKYLERLFLFGGKMNSVDVHWLTKIIWSLYSRQLFGRSNKFNRKKNRKKIVDFPFLGKTKNLIEFTWMFNNKWCFPWHLSLITFLVAHVSKWGNIKLLLTKLTDTIRVITSQISIVTAWLWWLSEWLECLIKPPLKIA
jgi:hypothetical protein